MLRLLVVTYQDDTIAAVAALLMAVAIVAEHVFGYGTGFRVIARCESRRSEQVGCNSLNCRHLSEY